MNFLCLIFTWKDLSKKKKQMQEGSKIIIITCLSKGFFDQSMWIGAKTRSQDIVVFINNVLILK